MPSCRVVTQRGHPCRDSPGCAERLPHLGPKTCVAARESCLTGRCHGLAESCRQHQRDLSVTVTRPEKPAVLVMAAGSSAPRQPGKGATGTHGAPWGVDGEEGLSVRGAPRYLDPAFPPMATAAGAGSGNEYYYKKFILVLIHDLSLYFRKKGLFWTR